MRARSNKAWKKIHLRRLARRRGYVKVYRHSFRREIAGFSACED